MKTTAVNRGDKYDIGSNIEYNGFVADWYFVVAYTEQEKGYGGMTAFIVERNSKSCFVGARKKSGSTLF